MASGTIKIRAKAVDGVAEVKALISHPMELMSKNKTTGEVVPAQISLFDSAPAASATDSTD